MYDLEGVIDWYTTHLEFRHFGKILEFDRKVNPEFGAFTSMATNSTKAGLRGWFLAMESASNCSTLRIRSRRLFQSLFSTINQGTFISVCRIMTL